MPTKVTTAFKNLPNGLEIPDGDLVIFTGPNNSGKSAILQYLNIYSPIKGDCDYISPRRFELSNEVAVALNSDAQLLAMWNQRKDYDPSVAELTAPDPIRELVSLPNVARQRIIDWHNRFWKTPGAATARRLLPHALSGFAVSKHSNAVTTASPVLGWSAPL